MFNLAGIVYCLFIPVSMRRYRRLSALYQDKSAAAPVTRDETSLPG